jgi:hypothetical protein
MRRPHANSKNLFSLILLLALVSASACTNQKTATTGNAGGSGIGITGGGGVSIGGHGNGGEGGTGGGADPGGGKFVSSSKDEIENIVNSVWAEVTSFGVSNPILIAYDKLQFSDQKSPEQEHIFEMLKKILWGDADAPKHFNLDEEQDFNKTRLALLKGRKIKFSDTGHCDGDQDDTLMAVTSFSFDGEICVNVEAMKLSTTSSSKFDVMALIVHEIGHLAGYRHLPKDETRDDLKRIQRFFLKYAAIFYRMDGSTSKGNFAMDVSFEGKLWSMLLDTSHQIDQSQISSLATAFMRYQLLIDRLPNPALEPELHIARPELYSETKLKMENVIKRFQKFLRTWFGYNTDPGPKYDPNLEITIENLDGKTQSWNQKLLNDMREILWARLDAELAVNNFLFGDTIPTASGLRSSEEINADREEIRKDTDPSVLKRPQEAMDLDLYNRLQNDFAIDRNLRGNFKDKEPLPKE